MIPKLHHINNEDKNLLRYSICSMTWQLISTFRKNKFYQALEKGKQIICYTETLNFLDKRYLARQRTVALLLHNIDVEVYDEADQEEHGVFAAVCDT